MFARNPWRTEFGDRVAFADLAGRQVAWTGDRTEFLGRNGTLDHPAALAGDAPLSNRVGAGLDPCGALQTRLELQAQRARPRSSSFSARRRRRRKRARLITRYRTADLDAVLRAVTGHWDDVLGTVQVTTPDRSMDILLNRWLLYQTLACRVWARSAFYQASGAYGFRDQLQDVMALTRVEAGADARASAARRGAAVRRGRRAALVAAAVGPGRAHADLRRPRLAAVRRRPLRRGHRRSRGARRDGSLPRRAGPARRRARLVLSAHGLRGARHPVRALRARPRPQSRGRRPRPAADRHRRLERRHEPGRRRTARARASGSAGSCTPRSRPSLDLADGRGETGARRDLAAARGRAAGSARARSAGTATGIGAATSTTARRSARPRAANAASIRSRSRGP